MSHEIASLTSCRLCEQRFTGPAVAIVGQPHARLARYLQTLAKHIIEAHPQENEAIQIKGLEYVGMLRLLNFASSDQTLIGQLDYVRWSVHQATLAVRIPDDKLKEKTAELAGRIIDALLSKTPLNTASMSLALAMRETFVQAVIEELIPTLTGMRDMLEEPGRYTLQQASPPTNGIIQPS